MSKFSFFLYSISNFLYKLKVPLVPKLITMIIYFFTNSYIPASCTIGKGSKFAYGGIGVVIHNRAIIGENCMIGQGVTIGGRSKIEEVPNIGNDVYIAAGARILGNVVIEDNVVIGANSVVIKNIASNSIVAGVPAKVIKSNIDISEYK